jgi:hypothetical protein
LNKYLGAVGVFYKTSGGVSYAGVYCYSGGVYVPCEDMVLKEYRKFLTPSQQLKVSRSVLEEVLEHTLPSKYNRVIDLESLRPMIAFEDGIFDWEIFIESGDIKKALKPFNPEYFVTHKIPHSLDYDSIRRELRGLVKYIPPETCKDMLEILKNLSPKAYNYLYTFAWYPIASENLVVSRICFLLEMIGRMMIPGYRLFGRLAFKDLFVILGPPNTGKTTFALNFMGEAILGKENIFIAELSRITSNDAEEVERLFGVAEHALALIIPDVDKRQRVGTWSHIRNVSGGGAVEARRLRENPYWYYPPFKIVIDANDPPQLIAEGYGRDALISRMRVIEFLNKNFKSMAASISLKEEDTRAIIFLSLYAVRRVYIQDSYSFTGVVDPEQVWRRYSEPPYAVLLEMISSGILELDPTFTIESKELYRLMVEYVKAKAVAELGEDATEDDIQKYVNKYLPFKDQREFTSWADGVLVKMGVRISKKSPRVYHGIGVGKTLAQKSLLEIAKHVVGE